MNESVIPEIVTIVDRRLNRATADRFSALPRDPRAEAIHWRVRRSLPPMPPGWGDLGDSIQKVIRERDPGSIIVELPDDTDEGGETLGDPWWAAVFAIMDAALGYACPELLAPEERHIMIDRWEAIFGPLRPAG